MSSLGSTEGRREMGLVLRSVGGTEEVREG
jgi:hypothetical protein